MADVVVPPLGESITEGVISKWLAQPGDSVEADEPVLDLETDKITVQIPAPQAGVLAEQRYGEGDTVRVGDVVATIGEAGAEAPAPAEAEPAREAERSREAPRANGGGVRAAAGAADGAARSADGERRGHEGPATAAPAGEEAPRPQPSAGNGAAAGRRLTPAQRRAQREGRAEARGEGAAPGAPEPSAGGAAQPSRSDGAPAAPSKPAAGAPAAEDAGAREEVVRMSPLRKRIAQRLVEAQQSTASLSTFNEVDMSAVMALRKRYQDLFVAEHDIKLGFMSFFVKAAVEALKKFPGVNAEVKDESIVYKKYYDLGIAVGTERGLIVPVLRGVDRLGFADIEWGIAELARKARENKLVLDDLMGATFSVTNGGIYGSMMSTPLLNFPQTGIFGMHNIVDRPVAVNGAVEIRPMMYIALTYDHRVVDGKEAVQFLVAIKERIEAPERLMFEL